MTTDNALKVAQVKSLIVGESNNIGVLANLSAFLNDCLTDINWVGFYLYHNADKNLQLGPFQGKVACMTIPINKGVCGTAAYQKRTIRVNDVHDFEGHIACDSASNAEIVIPIVVGGEVYGVLDVDSPCLNRFTMEDQEFLEAVVEVLEEYLSRTPSLIRIER